MISLGFLILFLLKLRYSALGNANAIAKSVSILLSSKLAHFIWLENVPDKIFTVLTHAVKIRSEKLNNYLQNQLR